MSTGNEEYWRKVAGIKNPVYIGIKRSRTKYVTMGYLFVALLIAISYIIEPLGYVPQGFGSIILLIVIISQSIIAFTYNYGRKLSETDIIYLQNILKEIKNSIIYWAIPSRNIPLIAMLKNALILVAFYRRGKLWVALVNPIIYIKSRHERRPVLKIKWIESRQCKDRVEGRAYVIIPRPDIYGVNTKLEGYALMLRADADNSLLKSIIVSRIKERRDRCIERATCG